MDTAKLTSTRRILISGSTGLIGQAVASARRVLGDDVVPLVRNGSAAGVVSWSPNAELDPAAVSGFDAVVHLAGEPVGSGRWTAEKKRRIRNSRVQGTRTLAAALAAAPHPPKVLVCASGINFYGGAGDKVLDENAPLGSGFLAAVCKEWEDAAVPLAGVSRLVHLRIGVVLSPQGGTLATMLPLFRLGLAGPIGGGGCFLSWITLNDVVRVIAYIIDSETLHGPCNVVSPEPVMGREFTAALAKAVGKPAVIPVPTWVARLMLGEMADETVLTSIRAVPQRLLEDGFLFADPNLSQALASWHLGGR